MIMGRNVKFVNHHVKNASRIIVLDAMKAFISRTDNVFKLVILLMKMDNYLLAIQTVRLAQIQVLVLA